jgi:hypothetical protein
MPWLGAGRGRGAGPGPVRSVGGGLSVGPHPEPGPAAVLSASHVDRAAAFGSSVKGIPSTKRFIRRRLAVA